MIKIIYTRILFIEFFNDILAIIFILSHINSYKLCESISLYEKILLKTHSKLLFIFEN